MKDHLIGVVIALGMLLAVWVISWFTVPHISHAWGAEMVCETTSDAAIQEAMKAEPSKVVAQLSGPSLQKFLSAMNASGYLVGTLQAVDKIYIIDAGKLPGYTSDNVWLFFMQNDCLIRAIPASKPVILEMLK